ncbi:MULTISPECIES: type IV secretion system protein [unclassified Pseudoxanthomonas]|uniref:virB8 family protein n=1 Tax=unclassified Pseudoxanthomonas TaxID=2645906 RepID=UPI0008F2CB6D|nr:MULTISPECIES: type IV secretion system protein [unclassified Pseudoxanthomonas]PPJ41508.1 conjugative transfer protein [Pseudoxanthomonas sp. KAs_5_3]SFV30103.1 type IV secretion system protein VirB8 [Pseudoxanthomonas sp. YR558]
MFNKKTSTPDIDRAVAQGVSFELTLADRARRSERRAWLVAWSAIVMSLILAGGYFLFLPLKEKVPYLVMADPYTGTASVARLSGNFQDRDITTEEAINKSNVAQFVLARESYDSGLIGQRNWRTTLSMAGPAVSPAYIALHSESNPERPFRLYGGASSVRTRILSIVLMGGGGGARPTGATVRYQRSLYDKGRGQVQPLDSRIATLEFTYNPDLRLSEEDRLLNPLGFRVTNYRVDDDFAAATVPEREFPAPQGVPATALPPSASMPGTDATAIAPADASLPNQNDVSTAPQPAEQSEPDTRPGVPQR